MKYSRGIRAASLVFVILSLLFVPPALAGQMKSRLIPFPEWAILTAEEEADEEIPLELVEIKVAGRRVTLGQPFEAGENWLNDMTLVVRNVGNKPITAFGVGGGLLSAVDEELPPRASFQHGIGWQWGKAFNPEKEKPAASSLKPGESVELNHTNLGEFSRRTLAKEGAGAFSKLKFMSPEVQYADGTTASSPKMRFRR